MTRFNGQGSNGATSPSITFHRRNGRVPPRHPLTLRVQRPGEERGADPLGARCTGGSW